MSLVVLPSGPSRNRTAQIRRIVVHAMGEWVQTEQGPIQAWDYLAQIGLSCHAYVTPSGIIVRQVDDAQVAFHAGRDNADTLGVEVLLGGVHNLASLWKGIDRIGWVGGEQFSALEDVVIEWCRRYELGADALVRHSDLDPQRKRDPGKGFPWRVLVSTVRDL